MDERGGQMTESELLNELLRLTSLPPLQEDDVTAARLALASGMTERHMLYTLKKMERDGKLKSHWARMPNGRRVQVFRKV